MDLAEANHNKELIDHDEECTAETYVDPLFSLGFADEDDISGEPQALPRLGDQYQAEIPSLRTELENLLQRQNPCNKDSMLGADYVLGIGLPIPIMWVQQVGDYSKHVQEFPAATVYADASGSRGSVNYTGRWIKSKFNSESGYQFEDPGNYSTLPQVSTYKVPDHPLEQGKEFAEPGGQCSTFVDHLNLGLHCLQREEGKSFYPLPGSPVISWSTAESRCFLLGLYIFGKNLVQIRKFMEGKKMADLLSFYYGKFYRSDAYRRWSECRKIRSRRCIHGQRIFTGWRQQELLARMLPGMLKEVQDTLLEATRAFSEGRNSLEEYVFTLKALIGIEKLVEAVGIGKGKHDLTGIVLDPVRTNHVIPVRPEIPVGKACSSLTSEDIIKFLTGDFRLSKAKSNDLFWEAVWPHLLAKGWHSEQPLDLASVGSKSTLVFLIPGIKKFSRKRLVKGNHYFDSVSDVLNKVASDPRLLNLETEGGKENNSAKEELDVDMKSDQNGLPDHQRNHYLHPKLSNFNLDVMKFTVVDTSLFHGETPFKLREVRSLPVDATYSYAPSSRSGTTDSDSSAKLPDCTDIPLNDQEESHPGISTNLNLGKEVESTLSDNFITASKKRIGVNGYDPDNRCQNLLDDKQPIHDLKSQLNHGLKSGRPNYLAPVSKRRRLTACKLAGSSRHTDSFSRGIKIKKEEPHFEWISFKLNENKDAEVDPSRGMTFTNSLANKASPDESSNSFSTSTFNETAISQGKEKPHPVFFDLNLPHFAPDFDANEVIRNDVSGNLGNLNPKEPSLSSGIEQQLDNFQTFDSPNCEPSLQQPTTNGLRQSTRSRPLTTKALEALACGFLSTKRKARGTKAHPLNNLTSRSSRRVRTPRAPMPSPTDVSITSPNSMFSNVGIQGEYSSYINPAGTQGVYGSYSNHANHASMFNESHVPPEKKETNDFLGVP